MHRKALQETTAPVLVTTTSYGNRGMCCIKCQVKLCDHVYNNLFHEKTLIFPIQLLIEHHFLVLKRFHSFFALLQQLLQLLWVWFSDFFLRPFLRRTLDGAFSAPMGRPCPWRDTATATALRLFSPFLRSDTGSGRTGGRLLRACKHSSCTCRQIYRILYKFVPQPGGLEDCRPPVWCKYFFWNRSRAARKHTASRS